jgi:hypothetical protein
MPNLTRESSHVTVTIANGANLSGEIDMSQFSMLIVHMPSAWTAASIGFKVASESGGTFLPLYDDDGNLLQIDSPGASKAYAAPAGVAGCSFVKLWSQNGSGTNTNQGGDRSIVVELKS